MADTFGARRVGRVYEGGKFYSEPSVDVPANAVYFPNPSGGGQFGVAEYPVAAGEKGAFSKVGTFAFPKPSGWTSVDGQAVYYTPSGQAAGAFSAAATTGAELIGYEVLTSDTPADQIFVDLK